MPRWITVRKPFDYHWPGRAAITAFREDHLGEHFVKDELADFAVAAGYATEGKVDEAARSRKGNGGKPRRARRAATAKAAKPRAVSPMADESPPDDDRAAGGPAVDPDA